MKFYNSCIIALLFSILSLPLHAKKINFETLDNSSGILGEPTATVSGGVTVCQNATKPLITFTGSGGTAPYTFIYTINGGTNQTILTSGINNSITLSSPTNVIGTFTYVLTSVKDKDNKDINISIDAITITVNPLPIVNFTFTNNQCNGTSIQFTSITTGTNTYLWDFGGSGVGNTSTNPNPSHIFNNTNGNSSQTFNVTLTIKDGNGCINTITKGVTIQNPDATLNSSADFVIYNGFPIFKVCTNDVSQIDFINTSTTSSTNSNYSINWGDSSPNFNSSTFSTNISHTYSVGLWTLTYTITSQNGCAIVKIYKVFVGNNPAVGIGNPGNTNVCISTPLTFPITGTDDNPPGTIYTITFNDGSDPILYNHPPPVSITHIFLKSSCGINSISGGGTTFQNSFSANIEASNPCDISSGSVVPIRVSTPGIANFSTPQLTTCINSQLCFTNTSIGGSAATNTSCATPKLIWSIIPSTGFTLSSGTLGSDNSSSNNTNTWITGTNIICPTFNTSGTYTITLKIGNSCGIDQISKTICVEAPLIPLFTLNKSEGCKPLNVTVTNTTDVSKTCSTLTYAWDVQYSDGYCGKNPPSWSYTGGTSASSASPSFNFVTPGTYSLKVTISGSSCGTITSPVQTVIVKQPATVTINALPNICQAIGSTSVTPSAVINSCAPSSSSLTYAWSFPGGIPTTAITANPGTINYSTSGTYTVSLSVTNECGTTIATNQNFTISALPTITGSLSSCVGQPSTLIGSTSPAITNPWQSSNLGVAKVSTTGLVTAIAAGTTTITYTNSIGCLATTLFTVNSLPKIIGTLNVCIGSNTNLSGDATPAVANAWISSNTAIATIDPLTGIVTGVSGGTATITYTNFNGCQTTVIITVNAIPTVSVNSPVVCSGLSTTVTAKPGIAGNYSYSWTVPSGFTNPGSFASFSTTIAGIYSVIITNTITGCKSASASGTVTANALPILMITNPVAVCSPNTIDITNANITSGSDSGLTFTYWTNIAATTALSNPNAVFGSGTFYIKAVNSNGCSLIKPVVVVINPLPALPIVSTISYCNNAVASALTASALANHTLNWYTLASGGSALTSAPTPSTSVVGDVIYYVSQTNITTGCEGNRASLTVTINPNPSVTVNSPVVCSGLSTVVTATPPITDSYSYSWIVAPGFTNLGSVATFSTTIAGVYSVIITNTITGCKSASVSGTVTANALPILTITNPNAVCSPSTIDITNANITTGSDSGLTFTYWTNSAATNALSNPNAVSSSGTYYIKAVNNNGCSLIKPVVVVINPLPVLPIISTISYCSNALASALTASALANHILNWYTVASGGSALTTAPTPSTLVVGDVIYYVSQTNTTTGCEGNRASLTVTINPNPSVTVNSPVVCSGLSTVVTATPGIAGNYTYSWIVPSGFTNPGSVASFSTTIAGVYNVIITNTITGCKSGSASGTVTANALPLLTITNPVAICSPSTIDITNANITSGSDSGLTFTYWTNSAATTALTNPNAVSSSGTYYIKAVNNNGCSLIKPVVVVINPLPVLPIISTISYCSNALASALTASALANHILNWYTVASGGSALTTAPTPSTLVVGDVIYYVSQTNTTTGCEGNRASLTVTINPNPSVTVNSPVVCSGLSTVVTATPGIAANYTYSWIVPSGFTNPGSVASFSTTIAGVYNVIITNTITGCKSGSASGTVTANALPALTITNPSAICSPTTIDITNSSITSGSDNGLTFTYWTNSAATTALTNPNAVSGNGTYYIKAVNSNGCSLIKPVVVVINSLPVMTIVNNIVKCNNERINPILFTSDIPSSIYSWTNNTPSIGLASSGTGNIASFNAVNTSTSPIIATITVDPIYSNGGVTCNGTSQSFTITINPTPSILSLSNQEYCNGVSTTLITINNTVPTTVNSWTNSNPTIGLLTNGIGDIPVFTATNNGNSAITATISISSVANGCSRPTETFTITVNPTPAITFSATPQTICTGDSTSIVALNSPTTGVTYNWSAVEPVGILGIITSGTATIPVQTLLNNTNVPIIVTYNATATIAGSSTCPGASYSYTITVNPKPVITETFTTLACSGSSFTLLPLDSAQNSIPAGTTYSWGIPVVTGGLTGGVSGVAQTSFKGTLFNPTNVAQSATYLITPSSKGCLGAIFTVTITVNPIPIIPDQTATICSGNSFTVTPINGTSNTVVPLNTSYTWTISNNNSIIGQLESTALGVVTISQNLTNLTNTVQTLNYTVTPTSGDTGKCMGATFVIVVTVNPKPSITNATPQSICSATSFSITPTNTVSDIVPIGTTYTWTTPISNPADAVSGGSTLTTAQNSISQTLTNVTNNIGTITYTVTPNSGSCQGAPFEIKILVSPIPKPFSLTNQVYCNGVQTAVIPFNNTVMETTYSWTNSNPTIGLSATDGILEIPSFTPKNLGTAPISSTLSVIATANGCSKLAETFTITVNPSPVVNFSLPSQTLCTGDNTAAVTLSSTTAGVNFIWEAIQEEGITGKITNGTNTIPAQTLVNTTNASIIVTYNATATIVGGSTCAGALFPYTITVNPKPIIDNQTLTICNNQSFIVNPINANPVTSTIVPPGTNYNWTVSSNPNIIGATAGSGLLISQNLQNISNTLQTVTYNVIPSYLNCIGVGFRININVNPTPLVNFDIQNQTICNNINSLPVNLSSNANGTIKYSWITNNPPAGVSGIILSGATNSIPSQLIVNNNATPAIINYSVTAEINGNVNCLGPSSMYSIKVNPTFSASGIISNYNGYGVSYFGGADGFINLTVIGGSGNYTYDWVGTNGYIAKTKDLDKIPAGTYTVTINDGYCNPILLTFILTQPPELLFQENLADHVNLLCYGDDKGALGVRITQESVSPYDFQLVNESGTIISTINNTTVLTQVFNSLIAGKYNVIITDGNGGVKKLLGLIVTQPNDIVITANTTPITCYGANNASITLSMVGGTAPYKAKWGNLATGFFQNNLAAGLYTILVTDANNCTKPITVNIPEALLFTVKPTIKNISCFGAKDGSINLNFVGGIPAINLTWSDGSTSGTVRNNLGPGTYSVTIIDGTPCTIQRTFTIVEPKSIVLSANLTDAFNCTNASSGIIDLIVAGGTPPFTYAWSNFSTTEDLNNITSGNYLVTVTDANGCFKTGQYSISRPDPLLIKSTTKTTFNCNTHEVQQNFIAQSSGGVPPYKFNWSSGTVSGTNNEIMSTKTNGTILLTSTDSYGCNATYSVLVNTPKIGHASFDSASYGYTTYGIYSISDPIQFTSTITEEYVSILWDFGDGTFSSELNPVHIYKNPKNYIVKQVVIYPFGCTYEYTISLIVEKGYLLVVPNAFTPNNDSLNDTFRPVTKGLKNVRLDVYDTWGSLLYSETGEVLIGWDSKIKGVNAENGNYYCKVSAETFYGTIINENHPFVLIK